MANDDNIQAKIGPKKPTAASVPPAPAPSTPAPQPPSVASKPEPAKPVEIQPAPKAPAGEPVPPKKEEITPVQEIEEGPPPFQEIDRTKSPAAPPTLTPALTPTPAPSAKPSAKAAAPLTPPPPPPPTKAGPMSEIKRGPSGMLKLLKIIIPLLIIAVGVFFFFFYRVTIVVSPQPAPDKIVIDSKEYKPGTIKLLPGNHSITVIKENYSTYQVKRKFSIGEKLEFKGEMKPALSAELVNEGATLARLSKDAKVVDFVSGQGKLSQAAASFSGKTPLVEERSNGSYQGVRKVEFSEDNSFALILDQSNLRVLDFTKSDLLNQVEAILPPMASAISSVTWNGGESSYFPEPNSRIVYDLKTSYGWDVISADRNHTKTDIAMQITDKNFSKINLDWSENQKYVLVVGGPACAFDIVSRTDCTMLSESRDFVWGKWGPKGQYGVLVDKNSELWKIKDLKAEKVGVQTAANLVSWANEKEAYVALSGRPAKINFDTNEVINYADIKGLKDATSFAVAGDKVFFTNGDGLKVAQLEGNVY